MQEFEVDYADDEMRTNLMWWKGKGNIYRVNDGTDIKFTLIYGILNNN